MRLIAPSSAASAARIVNMVLSSARAVAGSSLRFRRKLWDGSMNRVCGAMDRMTCGSRT